MELWEMLGLNNITYTAIPTKCTRLFATPKERFFLMFFLLFAASKPAWNVEALCEHFWRLQMITLWSADVPCAVSIGNESQGLFCHVSCKVMHLSAESQMDPDFAARIDLVQARTA
jgi:hypothetical protein